MSARAQRVEKLRSEVGTVLETRFTLPRIAEYEAMTDEQYDAHIAQARSMTVARMAGELMRRRG